jgi:hypothetical protein
MKCQSCKNAVSVLQNFGILLYINFFTFVVYAPPFCTVFDRIGSRIFEFDIL